MPIRVTENPTSRELSLQPIPILTYIENPNPQSGSIHADFWQLSREELIHALPSDFQDPRAVRGLIFTLFHGETQFACLPEYFRWNLFSLVQGHFKRTIELWNQHLEKLKQYGYLDGEEGDMCYILIEAIKA